ncbi:MAG: UDP-galactopyranose mutase [Chitinophagaceae bacterium]|nr:UDP-galactopyranose mutase [Chitinophagaceae bacterium]
MSKNILVVGAGPVGCVMSERFANVLGCQVTLIDKRAHIAGNCFDNTHKNGLLYHQYGPHYFRTNDKALFEYLSKFTEWIPGNYYVTSFFKNEFYPFPINLKTLAKFFKRDSLTPKEAEELLESKREKIASPENSEEFVLSRVGREMYEAFYLGYTLKQWALHPKELSPSVCGRIPIRFNEDCRYVDHEYQFTPKDGFTKMFAKMIEHPLINLKLETNFEEVNKDYDIIIYTGAIDEYFNYCFGKLQWRSLEFDFKVVDQEFVQDNVQINYSNDHDYTRSVEIKHVTKQKHAQTIVSYEYPTDKGDPYYPIPTENNQQLYLKYQELAIQETKEKNVFFCGRLAEYKYYNTDEVILKAFQTFEEIKKSKFEVI